VGPGRPQEGLRSPEERPAGVPQGSERPVRGGRPLLVLVDSLARSTREYLLASIARQYDIWLFQGSVPTWEAPYIVGYTVVDTLDSSAMADAAAGLGARGVLCWDEVRIEAAAALAEALGLACGEPEVIRRCRDKYLTRTVLGAASVPQPQSLPVADLTQARAAAGRIGYPVVLKPRALAGSYGVMKVESAAELAAAFRHAQGTSLAGVPPMAAGVLVEEYLDGPEVSVDSVCLDGVVTPLFLARKRLGFPPYFEEVGHVVDSADPLWSSAPLRDLLTAVHAAVGLTAGWTHTEIRLTGRGPRLVEVNARLGGDMIPYLGRLATGIDPGPVAAAAACGLRPALSACQRGVAAIRFLYPPHDMVAEAITVDESRLPAGLDQVKVLASPGQEVRLPPRGHISGRFAYVIVSAESPAACAALLDAAAAAIEIRGTATGPEAR
jgi:biotin carboxylase